MPELGPVQNSGSVNEPVNEPANEPVSNPVDNAGDEGKTQLQPEPQPQPAQGSQPSQGLPQDISQLISQMQQQYEEQIRLYEELLRAHGIALPEEGDFDQGYDDYGYGDELGGADNELLQQLLEEIEDLKLEREIEQLSRKYDDFEPNLEEILQTALDLGIDNLEVAYRYWKMDHLPPPPDIEAIKKQAVEEYLSQKRDQASKPAPQGGGGGVPSSTQKPKTLDEATRSALRRLERAM